VYLVALLASEKDKEHVDKTYKGRNFSRLEQGVQADDN